MKSRKLYITYEELALREELKGKYSIKENKLTGHTVPRLYPLSLYKRELMPPEQPSLT